MLGMKGVCYNPDVTKRGRRPTGPDGDPYKDLCIDAVDAHRLGRFWALALGLDLGLEPDDGPDADLSGPTPQHRVWINTVPEPKTVKQRVHLDVHGASVDEHVAWGATVRRRRLVPLDGDGRPRGWRVLPVRRGTSRRVPALRVGHRRGRAAGDRRLVGRRARARTEHDDEGFPDSTDIPGAPFEWIVFVPVPEPKTVKNRIHSTSRPTTSTVSSPPARRLLRPRDDEIGWNVMADPEGNEFCAFVA